MLKRDWVWGAAFFICMLSLSACELHHELGGPPQSEPIAIDAGSAKRTNVELDMGAGELVVRGGAEKLLQGRFEYNFAGAKPIVQTSSTGIQTAITIKEPNHMPLGNGRYLWDLELNDHILVDMTVNCGAGKAQLELGELELRSVNVNVGVGEVNVDLRGHPMRDYDVNISGGVGQATIRLPQGVGIRAEAHGGIGSIDVSGLEKRGDHYENSLYPDAKTTVHVTVNGGIGGIRIIG